MKIYSNYLAIVFFLFMGILTPQRNDKNANKHVSNITQKETESQSEFNRELEKYKDSIKMCVEDAQKSREVISLNEVYLKNLDKKIKQLHKQQNKQKIAAKVPPRSRTKIKVYHLDSTCVKQRSWIGRQLNESECRTWKIDTVWAVME